MLSDQQLDEAVAKGLIQPEQRQALAAMASNTAVPQQQLKSQQDASDDEGFRFISGFNDIFLAIGVGMLLYGLSLSTMFGGIATHIFAAAILWGLGELFAGYLKRTLPSMIVAAAFVYHVASIASLWLVERSLFDIDMMALWSDRAVMLPLIASGLLAAVIFYLRFKLPFSLFLVGAQVLGFVVIELVLRISEQTVGYIIPALFVSGLTLFAIAMWYDTSDRLRLTRLSDNAFWLHLLASPLIVHSIMWQSAIWIIGQDKKFLLNTLGEIAPLLALVVLIIFVLLMLVALIIDRRAMLVSSLIYVSIAVTYFASQGGSLLKAASFTPVLIGTAIIALGVGWRPLRQLIFTMLPLGSIQASLPPIKS